MERARLRVAAPAPPFQPWGSKRRSRTGALARHAAGGEGVCVVFSQLGPLASLHGACRLPRRRSRFLPLLPRGLHEDQVGPRDQGAKRTQGPGCQWGGGRAAKALEALVVTGSAKTRAAQLDPHQRPAIRSYGVVWFIFVLLGTGTLLPWNVFLTVCAKAMGTAMLAGGTVLGGAAD